MSNEGYTVKERLEDLAKTIAEQLTGIVKQLDKIDAKLDDKASNQRVDELERRFLEFERQLLERLLRLERQAAGVAAISGYQRWLVGGLGCTIVGALLYVLLGSH
jgi:Skp family chaperone for outer membrane proteins